MEDIVGDLQKHKKFCSVSTECAGLKQTKNQKSSQQLAGLASSPPEIIGF